MKETQKARRREGLAFTRLMMVLSSMAPLFILWALRGSALVDDRVLLSVCAGLVLVPLFVLWLRIALARRAADRVPLRVEAADDHRDHILVYLIAMMLPFYSAELGSWRYLAATLCAVGLVVLLFWHLNLHYLNLFFVVFGYRVFTVRAGAGEGSTHRSPPWVVITRRARLEPGDQLTVVRVSNTVYIEEET